MGVFSMCGFCKTDKNENIFKNIFLANKTLSILVMLFLTNKNMGESD